MLIMHISSILNPPTESHPPKSSAGNSASNPQPIARTMSTSTPSINVHETTATIEAPVPDLDAIAESALPYLGFDDMYDDSRHPSPEVDAGPDEGLSNLPPSKESNVRGISANGEPSLQIMFPTNSHMSPAAPTSGVNVHGTTAASSPGAQHPIPAWLERIPPIASRPIDMTTAAPSSGINIYGTASSSSRGGPRRPAPLPAATSPLTSRWPDPVARYSDGIPNLAEIIDVDASVTQPNAAARSSNRIPDDAEILDVDASVTRPAPAARYSNGIPDVAEIIDVDAPLTRPNAVARSSNVIPDVAEIIDVDAREAQRRTQVTPPPSNLSVQVGSSAPPLPVQASSRTLSQSEQIAVEVLASNSRSREISQGPSGSRTRSNAKSKDDNPFPGRQEEPWYYLDIEIARENRYDEDFGAALLCAVANNCHKRNEIRNGKQREDEAPLSPLVPSIEDHSSIGCESCDEECEACDEAAANMEYIYNVRARPQTRHGNELETIRAHPGDAVWALVESRLDPVNDPRKWETACNRCNPCSEEQREEQREQTIPLEKEAVDEAGNRIEGAAPYNPDLYTTTSSMRELRVKPQKSKAKLKDKAMSTNISASSASDQASSSGSNAKGKQKANDDSNSNERQPTPRLPSARATSSRTPDRGTKGSNGDINSDASGIHTCSPPRPPSPTRTSLRNRQLFGPQTPLPLPPLPPAPVVASSSRRSQCYAPSPLGLNVDSINATTPEQSQSFSNNETKEADNADAEQGKRRAKEKKSVNGDSKQDGKANNKRKVSEDVEDADAGSGQVTRSRRKMFSNPSNGSNELGASQNAPDPVTRSTSRAIASRSEGSSERRVRLRLRVSAEANPKHPDHETYMMRKKREKQ